MNPETKIQNGIELAFGAEQDVLVLRNSCGHAEYTSKRTGKTFHVPYGLGAGSPAGS